MPVDGTRKSANFADPLTSLPRRSMSAAPLSMFLTRPTHGRPGDPDRARPCRCPRPCPDEEGGCLCGFWLADVIDATWAMYGPPKPQPHSGVPAQAPAGLVPFERRLVAA